MRTPIVAGNWKMNLGMDEAVHLARGIAEGAPENGVKTIVAPVSLHLSSVTEALATSPVLLSAQNMHWSTGGAYTGEVSGPMLRELAVRYVILGHSERRQYFGETDEEVNHKVHSALDQDLRPIICLGETLDQRESKRTEAKVEFQLRAALSGLTSEQAERIIVAYEPIWAIGTGKTASPQQAQQVHAFLRQVLEDRFDRPTSRAIPILYGGSVKPHNFDDLITEKDIDGGLVGGASLQVDSFLKLAQIAHTAS